MDFTESYNSKIRCGQRHDKWNDLPTSFSTRPVGVVRGDLVLMYLATFYSRLWESTFYCRATDQRVRTLAPREHSLWQEPTQCQDWEESPLSEPFKARQGPTASLMQLRLSHGKSQSIWQKPTTWQKSECLGFVIGWPLPVYSGKTQGGYKK